MGWHDSLDVCTRLWAVIEPGVESIQRQTYPGVLQAGWFINVCAVPRMGIKLDVPSAGMNWWTLKIPQCASRRVGKLTPTPWTNYKYLEWLPRGFQQQTSQCNLCHEAALTALNLPSGWIRWSLLCSTGNNFAFSICLIITSRWVWQHQKYIIIISCVER